MLRRHSLERRLFGWLLVLALVPSLLLLGAALSLGARTLQVLGTLGPWAQVAESGRALFEAAGPAASADPALDAALEAHRRELSESLVQAQRWSFLGNRLATIAPFLILSIGLLVIGLSLLASRRIARDIARPVRELVDWADRMARGDALPDASAAEAREVSEVRSLRAALRAASIQIAQGRERALEAERVRAWGEMARRVAHEMKNPLTPLRLAAHRLSAMPDERAAREAIAVIEEETARLDEMARSFAVLGRPSAGTPSPVDLEELLTGLIATDVPPDVRGRIHVETGTSTIQAYYDALLRAFRNLVRNAVEAVEGGDRPGEIVVRLTPLPDAGVQVSVADNGRGFPDGVAERIFEADFTLKPGGTGLGLAVVRQAIAAHGGEVSARGRPEGGAEFIVRLPSEPVPSST